MVIRKLNVRVKRAPRPTARQRLDPARELLQGAFASPAVDAPASQTALVVREEPEELELVPPPAAAPILDIGLGEVANNLSARVRVNGKLGVLIAETPIDNESSLIMVQYDGEAKPRKFYAPPAVIERLL